MSRQYLVMDAWMREAREAVKLVEDVETRVKSKKYIVIEEEEEQKQLLQYRLGDDIARSKLMEAGVLLDRLESLLYNPPSKPILTQEDLELRWKMVSDTKLKMKEMARDLYKKPSPNRTGGLAAADVKGTSRAANSNENEQIKVSIAKEEPELLTPLISDNTTQSHLQIRHSTSASLLWKVCWTVCVIFGAAAFVFILAILCA